MTRRTTILLSVLLALSILTSACCSQETSKPPTFDEVLVKKTVSLMPAEHKTKLTAVEKDIITEVRAVSRGNVQNPPVYFLDTREGTGPSQFAEQFALARKAVAEKQSHAKLAPILGRLATCVISLCQPYHSEKKAFDSEKRVAFGKELDASAPSLQADFDKFDIVRDPSEYAINLAKQANEILTKAETAESADAAKVRAAVYALAVNSLADCWWTVLSQNGSPSESYIGNKRSKKLHRATCRHLPDEKNREVFKSRDEAIKQGYQPCKVCKP